MAPVPAADYVFNGTILIAITLIVLPIAAIAFARSGPAWREIGSSGQFAIDPEPPVPEPDEAEMPLDPAAQEAEAHRMLQAEIRQLVLARNERRMRQGKAPLDVEAEVEREAADFIGSS